MPEEIGKYLEVSALLSIGQTIAIALLTIIVGWMIAGWAQSTLANVLERNKVDTALSRFLGQIARYAIIAATLIAAAEAVGFQTTSLMAIFASAGLAVGLALQGSLSNFAAGVMILFFRPFTIGDVVSTGGCTGEIIEIGLFATVLMKLDGTKVIVGNSSVSGGTIENHTVLGKRRGTVEIGVDYGSDLEQVRAALTRAAQNVPEILDDPGFDVVFLSFGGSSLDWVIHCWSKPADFLPMLEKLKVNVYNELNAANIGIPFPQLDVRFPDGMGNNG